MDKHTLIGKRIRAFREKRALSQENLSLCAGISVDTVSNAERGKPLNIKTLLRISEALGVGVSELVDNPKSLNEKILFIQNRFLKHILIDSLEAHNNAWYPLSLIGSRAVYTLLHDELESMGRALFPSLPRLHLPSGSREDRQEAYLSYQRLASGYKERRIKEIEIQSGINCETVVLYHQIFFKIHAQLTKNNEFWCQPRTVMHGLYTNADQGEWRDNSELSLSFVTDFVVGAEKVFPNMMDKIVVGSTLRDWEQWNDPHFKETTQPKHLTERKAHC